MDSLGEWLYGLISNVEDFFLKHRRAFEQGKAETYVIAGAGICIIWTLIIYSLPAEVSATENEQVALLQAGFKTFMLGCKPLIHICFSCLLVALMYSYFNKISSAT
ncbi:hypothetical protein [Vibrio owensii]|uniref:hypothetical protein n=1 Tax=Vibrio owensii TaxID=696485 RepID=UPI003CC53A64